MTPTELNAKIQTLEAEILAQPNGKELLKESCERIKQGKSGLIKKIINEIEKDYE